MRCPDCGDELSWDGCTCGPININQCKPDKISNIYTKADIAAAREEGRREGIEEGKKMVADETARCLQMFKEIEKRQLNEMGIFDVLHVEQMEAANGDYEDYMNERIRCSECKTSRKRKNCQSYIEQESLEMPWTTYTVYVCPKCGCDMED